MLNSSSQSPSATATATATAAAAAVTAASAATANPFLWNVDELTPVPPQPPPPLPLSLALAPKPHTNTQLQLQQQTQQHLPNYAQAPTSQLPFNYYARAGSQHYGSHMAAMRERNFDFYRRGEQFAYERQQQQLERRLQVSERKSGRNKGIGNNRNNQNNTLAQSEDDPNEAILLSNDSDDEDLPASSKMATDYHIAVEKYLNFEGANKAEVKLTLNKQEEIKTGGSDIAPKAKEEETEELETTTETKRQKEENSNCQDQTAMNNKCNNDDATLTNTTITIAPPHAELGNEKLKDVAGCENVAHHVAQVALE